MARKRAFIATIAAIALCALGAIAAAPAGAVVPGTNGKIAFVSARDGFDLESYTMNANGTGVTRLTNSVGWDALPR